MKSRVEKHGDGADLLTCGRGHPHVYYTYTCGSWGDTCYSRFTQKFDLAAGAGLNSVFSVMLSATNSLPA